MRIEERKRKAIVGYGTLEEVAEHLRKRVDYLPSGRTVMERDPVVLTPAEDPAAWGLDCPRKPAVGFVGSRALCLVIDLAELREEEGVVEFPIGGPSLAGIRRGTKLAALRRFGPLVEFTWPEEGTWRAAYVPVAWLDPVQG